MSRETVTIGDEAGFCKCSKCRYANTPACKVVQGVYSKIAYCRGPYKE
jgi:hypothetical protein